MQLCSRRWREEQQRRRGCFAPYLIVIVGSRRVKLEGEEQRRQAVWIFVHSFIVLVAGELGKGGNRGAGETGCRKYIDSKQCSS